MKKITFVLLTLMVSTFSWSQCTTGTSYQGATLANSGTWELQSSCNYTGEYSNTTGVIDGDTYSFRSAVATDYITVTSSDGAIVYGHGVTPLTLTIDTSGDLNDQALRVYYHDDAACGESAACRVTEVKNDSATPPTPPANDLFADAIAINVGDTVLGTTIAATQDEASAPDTATVETDTSADNDSPWVWYSLTHNIAERITVSTCNPGSNFDTEIFVYTGSSGALTCIDDGYDECGSPGFFAETEFDSDGSTTYYIAIGGWNVGNVGDFELSVSAPSLSDGPSQELATFTYYPNPVDNTLTLNAQNNIESVRMYNMLGQEVISLKPQTIDSELDLSNLETGTYFVQVTIAGFTNTVKVLKK